MCSLKLPKTVIDTIDKFRKTCLWRGSDINAKGYNLAAWEMVTIPKNKGGLGVKNLYMQNDALLIKHLDKFYNKADIPWVHLVWDTYYSQKVPHLAPARGSFWWKDILKLNTQFRGIANCSPEMGDSVGLWEDSFSGQPWSMQYHSLYMFANNKSISLAKARSTADLTQLFRLPMTRDAYNEFLDFQTALGSLPHSQDQPDTWTYIWNNDRYSSSKFYQHHFATVIPPAPLLWIWKSKCMPRVKFFAWLLLVDRLNTRNVLRRRNKHLEEVYNCVMCHEHVEETAMHLFFECPSTTARWYKLNIQWQVQDDIFQTLLLQRPTFNSVYFMEIVMLAAWSIWKERNAFIFNNKVPSISAWTAIFTSEVKLHLHRLPTHFHPVLMDWLNNL